MREKPAENLLVPPETARVAHADRRVDYDSIQVGISLGRFRAIQLRVYDGMIFSARGYPLWEMARKRTFQSGIEFAPEGASAQSIFPANGESSRA